MKKNFVKKTLSLSLAALILVACFPISAFAAEDPTGTLTITEIIAPVYEDAGSFNDGLAPVMKDGKWGYIDTDNNVVIPFIYDVAYGFSEGLAIVGTIYQELVSGNDELYIDYTYSIGSIDKNGNYTQFYAPSYYTDEMEELVLYSNYVNNNYEYQYYNGYCLINGMLYDIDGKAIDLEGVYPYFTPTEGTIVGAKEAIYGMYYFRILNDDFQLEQIGSDDFETYTARPFNQGLAPFYIVDWETETGAWGFIDKTGKIVIPAQYPDIMVTNQFTEFKVFGETGMATAMNQDGKWGMIDKTGKVVIPFKYDAMHMYSEGLVAFCLDGKYGYLDHNGKVAIENKYKAATPFNNGLALVHDGEKAYLIDRYGNPVKGSEKANINTYFKTASDGSFIVYTIDTYLIIEEDGKYGYSKIDYTPALPKADQMDSWAYPEVTSAIEEGLVPVSLQNMYTKNITRKEFANLVIRFIETVRGKEIADIVAEITGKSLESHIRTYPFADCANTDVIAASALGIIGGKGNRVFDPYANITRQEAAAMLARTANVLGIKTTGAITDFADSKSFATWATDSINTVVELGVMKGVSDNRFDPSSNYTREQAFITFYRLLLKVR